MLSDEERKVIDELKEEINKPLEVPEDKFDTFILYNIESAKTILNLIEKQSKEIEELNLKNEKLYEDNLTLAQEIKEFIEGTNDVKYYSTSFIKNHYISKDKIKAKIEPKLKELDEQINEEWKKYGNSKELQDMEDMYNFLQSLLEKE